VESGVPNREYKIDTHLVVRESTGYPPGTMENLSRSGPRTAATSTRRKVQAT
jgi:hypothetical protein